MEETKEIMAWAIKNPDGSLLVYSNRNQPPSEWTNIVKVSIREIKEGEESGWISVEDRLPYTNGNVLCFRLDNVTMIMRYNFEEGFLYSSSVGDLNQTKYVTHWMSLPTPPIK